MQTQSNHQDQESTSYLYWNNKARYKRSGPIHKKTLTKCENIYYRTMGKEEATHQKNRHISWKQVEMKRSHESKATVANHM